MSDRRVNTSVRASCVSPLLGAEWFGREVMMGARHTHTHTHTYTHSDPTQTGDPQTSWTHAVRGADRSDQYKQTHQQSLSNDVVLWVIKI